MIKKSPNRYQIISFLAACSLFFSSLEYLIPKIVPFFRIGLANFPLLLVLPFFRWSDFLYLTLLKVLSQGLLNGTLISYVFLFSFSGSFISSLIMLLLRKTNQYIPIFSLRSISLYGALASNLIQGLLSFYFIFKEASFIILPYLLIIGSLSGFILGHIAQKFYTHSQWIKKIYTDYHQ